MDVWGIALRVCAGSSWRPVGFLLMAAPQTVVLGQFMIKCLGLCCLRKNCHGWRPGQSVNGTREDVEFSHGACAGAQPFLFHMAVLKKGSSLAGGLALPVQEEQNLYGANFSAWFSLVHSQATRMLALLVRASQAVPWGVGWAR